MMNEGFILINRKITEWEWYKDLNTKSLFLHCLIMANYEEKKWQGITVQRGSFISSIAQLSQQTGISTQSIRTSINHLKSTGELTSKSKNKYTIYTVLNYNLYQSPNKQPNNRLTSNQQATNKQLTTTKELKELKELKENTFNTLNTLKEKNKQKRKVCEEIEKTFIDFKDMRAKIKKPLTEHAEDLIVKRLESLSNNHETQKKILEQSILNSWANIYPLKERSERTDTDNVFLEMLNGQK